MLISVPVCVFFFICFGFVENAFFTPEFAGLDNELTEETMSPPIEEAVNRLELSPVMVRFVNMADYTKTIEGQKVPEIVNTNRNTTRKTGRDNNPVESWCVIWYLGAFGSLVCFFLIITCTELFFGNPLYRENNLNALVHSIVSSEKRAVVPETPPPPYHLFAPPDYSDTVQSKTLNDKRKTLEVYVVPVHGKSAVAAATGPSTVVNVEPPQYNEATQKMVEDKLNVFVVAGAGK